MALSLLSLALISAVFGLLLKSDIGQGILILLVTILLSFLVFHEGWDFGQAGSVGGPSTKRNTISKAFLICSGVFFIFALAAFFQLIG